MLSFDSLPPPPGAFPTRQLWDLLSLGQSSRRGRGTSPSHGGIHQLEPGKWWRQSLGETEEGGEEEERGVCVCMWGWNLCAESSQVAALPCEILIISASAISAVRSGPPLLNISSTPLTSHCTSPTFLPPIDPSAPQPLPGCHQHQPRPGAPCSIPILDMPVVTPAQPCPGHSPPWWGESREAILRKEDHQLHWEHNISAHQQVQC